MEKSLMDHDLQEILHWIMIKRLNLSRHRLTVLSDNNLELESNVIRMTKKRIWHHTVINKY